MLYYVIHLREVTTKQNKHIRIKSYTADEVD